MSKQEFKNRLHSALVIMNTEYLKPEYRKSWNVQNPTVGYCYVVSEAIYHIAKEKGVLLHPHVMRSPDGTTHWFLKNGNGKVIDYTSDQFPYQLNYGNARRTAFLTKKISKRGKALYDLLHVLAGKLPKEIDNALNE